MSPLAILQRENKEEEGGGGEEEKKRRKKKELTLLPSCSVILKFGRFFSLSRFFLLHYINGNDNRNKNITTQRASSDDVYSRKRECISRFFLYYVFKRTSLHSRSSYFFACVAYIARPKQRKMRPLILLVPFWPRIYIYVYVYIYYATKVIWSFFLLSRER